MTVKDEIIEKAKNSILDFDEDMAEKAAHEALKEGISPLEVIEKGFTAAMEFIGGQFEKGELFLPHVLAASEAMNAGIAVLKPEMEKRSEESKSLGKVVIGTIEGDIHSIGKEIVASMLGIAGFKVIDLGKDVAISRFVESAQKFKPDIVASSALMTTTMVCQVQLEEQLKEAGIRGQVKTMVGGAPCTQKWADQIGADIYAENANDAVAKAKALVA
ncbi:dimethylamine corrinoid protein 3 [Methanosarcina sp. 2.H.T.1A.6]|uniref:methyltransferase cognate corrinoid protein n=1 Tax=unclassified Methanosarcina TaxID=2644672 RepID=UPI0006216EEB|nr:MULTISPECIES: methyltransferase cognate corrinoid protein [unclassified Methanosarcina]KKG12027.1 dimethylamine corrinoid protein 3 [Methanosarcina sp. 2.H.T.1A.15]KKG15917.1 dimethylamine corrinoid protein 3 [Methanosarcina sp. 2.H.T.1A.3]KKG21056.1 dimethylamine corrinoid protein 3 [Methanosarcina sp. 2.H.T.1A.6]KKG23802.1 dimethylamine corrinoid protein 3 [Methanosarcina sp. 2.H.T.1A.8]